MYTERLVPLLIRPWHGTRKQIGQPGSLITVDAVTAPLPTVKGRPIGGYMAATRRLYADGASPAGAPGLENWTRWPVRVSLPGVP
jgi:hypothetical protein